MNLNLNKITEKLAQSEFIKKFMEELDKTLENSNNIELTNQEEIEFERKEFNFLQEYFEKELLDLSKGEVFIVTDKYENDELNRYKVTQYKDNLECKYIAFQKDLPHNVKIRDVVRKMNGSYIYDEQGTVHIKKAINKIKQEIVNNRNDKKA